MTKPAASLQKAFDGIRKYALSFPTATEDFPWGHSAFKVNKKAFVFASMDQATFSLSVKLPHTNALALEFSFAAPTGYGLAKSGWVTATFGPKDKVPMAMMKDWIGESFAAIAPKRLLKAEAKPAKSDAKSPGKGASPA